MAANPTLRKVGRVVDGEAVGRLGEVLDDSTDVPVFDSGPDAARVRPG